MTIWYYTPKGQPAVYQEGQYLYDQSGACLYWEQDGWWFAMDGGTAAYFRDKNWLFTPSGAPAFYSS